MSADEYDDRVNMFEQKMNALYFIALELKIATINQITLNGLMELEWKCLGGMISPEQTRKHTLSIDFLQAFLSEANQNLLAELQFVKLVKSLMDFCWNDLIVVDEKNGAHSGGEKAVTSKRNNTKEKKKNKRQGKSLSSPSDSGYPISINTKANHNTYEAEDNVSLHEELARTINRIFLTLKRGVNVEIEHLQKAVIEGFLSNMLIAEDRQHVLQSLLDPPMLRFGEILEPGACAKARQVLIKGFKSYTDTAKKFEE